MKRNNKGFAVIELAVTVLVVAALAVAGYAVYHRGNETVAPPAKISSASDVKKAIKSLDSQDPSKSLDTSTLDALIAQLL